MKPTIENPDFTMHESDLIFRSVDYSRPRGAHYPDAWRELQARAFESIAFREQLDTAIRTHCKR